MRVAPTLEKKRDVAKQRQKAKAVKKRVAAEPKKALARKRRELAVWSGDMNIKRETQKIWKLLEPYHGGKPVPKVLVQTQHVHYNKKHDYFTIGIHGSYAYITYNQIHLQPKSHWGVLAHELVHCAVGVRRKQNYYAAHDEVFYKCYKDITERRWKVKISFYGVPKWGYAVDGFIEKQAAEQGAYKFPSRKKEVAE